MQGYEIHAGAEPLKSGGYGPRLVIRRKLPEGQEQHILPVPGPVAFLTAEEARESAFEPGVHWVKHNS